MIFRVNYKLVNKQSRAVLLNNYFTLQRSFTLPRDGYAEMIAIADAEKLGMSQVAQTIIDNLNSYFFQLTGQ